MLNSAQFGDMRVTGHISGSSPAWWSLFLNRWRSHPPLEACSSGQQAERLSRCHTGVHLPSAMPQDYGSFENRTAVIHVERAKEPFTVANQLRRTLFRSWINILILAAPVGIALNYIPWANRIVVFVVNFVAIIPLAAMLSLATEDVALRTGETLGGLINATFGNAVELIVAVIALRENKVAIVQMSLIGSVLSNVLLVTGFCFFFGGLRRKEQHFNTTFTQTASSLQIAAAGSVTLLSVFKFSIPNIPQGTIAEVSRGTSVILLTVYIAYLVFQLRTHHAEFKQKSHKAVTMPWPSMTERGPFKPRLATPSTPQNHRATDQTENQLPLRAPIGVNSQGQDEAEDEDPELHLLVAIVLLVTSTIGISFTSEPMVGSIDAVTQQGGLTELFVGLILLPIVGNAAEHATAVTVAMKDKMDLAMAVAVGSGLQVALFLMPLLVVVGWGMGKTDMDLSFDVFQIAVLFFAVLLINSVTADNKSNWSKGLLLICAYAVIALCAFRYPNATIGKTNAS